MAQFAVRTIIALVGFALFIYAFPLILSILGLDIAGNGMQLVRLCAGVIALCYIVWGSAVG